MPMQKSLLIGMVIASLWAATGFVQPVWGQDEGHARRGGMLLRLIHKADLTPDQKMQLKGILERHRETLQGLRTELQAKREMVTDALLKAGTTMATLLPLAQDVNETQAKIALERLNTIFEVVQILTPPQLDKL